MRRILMCLFLTGLTSVTAFSQVEITPEIQLQIRQSLEAPAVVYRLDYQENQVVFDRIDLWLRDSIDLTDVGSTRDLRNRSTTYSGSLAINIPIFLDEGFPGLEPTESYPFRVVQGKQKRELAKSIWIGSETRLTNIQVETLAADFLKDNRFVMETGDDRIGECTVLTWKAMTYTNIHPDGVESILQQRATFGRTFQGLSVVNAFQIVDMNPGSREVLAYVHVNWTPVLADSGQERPKISLPRVLELIVGAFPDHPNAELEQVKRGWLQTERELIPVLEIKRKVLEGEDSRFAKRTVLIRVVRRQQVQSGFVSGNDR